MKISGGVVLRRLQGWLLCLAVFLFFVMEAKATQHFSIKEAPSPRHEYVYNFGLQLSTEIFQIALADFIFLMDFEAHEGPLPKPKEAYNRNKHFGTWVRMRGCSNTRHYVLARDSRRTVEWNGCNVSKGEWYDPFTGNTYRRPKDIEVDHFVALKNAYLSGAWKWDRRTRCIYTNFIGNQSHLKAISKKANRTKSDFTPERYMPENEAYACTYLKEWLLVKAIWGLMLTSSEVEAIENLAVEKACYQSEFKVELETIVEQRNLIRETDDYCKK